MSHHVKTRKQSIRYMKDDLRKDMKRVNLLLLLSIVIVGITHLINTCIVESFVCLGIAAFGSIILNILWIANKNK
ncbi:hypothetical protein [Enterococcus sp. AZ007]|uniref:hypothetical protein n=1 Tax=Enterococcus sp. AZ007 TaxID=2774839 RepID=UPI003F1F8E00